VDQRTPGYPNAITITDKLQWTHAQIPARNINYGKGWHSEGVSE